MDDYNNVTLVKITDDRIVTIGDERFLIVDNEFFSALRANRKPRLYTDTTELKEAILEILEEHPGSPSRHILRFLDEQYDFRPAKNIMRGCLQRLKDAGQIFNEGEKSKAVWFIKE